MYNYNNKYQHAHLLYCAYDPYMICNLIIQTESKHCIRPEKSRSTPQNNILKFQTLGAVYADRRK